MVIHSSIMWCCIDKGPNELVLSQDQESSRGTLANAIN